ncbi:MAG TPA: SHOCT domain-containing protein [Candidatus Acidoferrum sp.]|nr:SHOCT domain-containing protein [Candidatus Acidoferrum sp.]
MKILCPYDIESTWTAIRESVEENKGEVKSKRGDEQINGKVRKLIGGGDFSIKVLQEEKNVIVSMNTDSKAFEDFFNSMKKRLPNCSDITEKFQKKFCVKCKNKLGLLKQEQWLTWHFGNGMLCVGCYARQKMDEEKWKKIDTDSNSELLCKVCNQRPGEFLGPYCEPCGIEKFGQVILMKSNGQYHGGHKAFVAGGYAGKFEIGRMSLTERFFIFTKYDKNPLKRIEIIIPLNSVQMQDWGIEEETRRKSVSMGGFATSTGLGAVGVGAGSIHDEGKAHHIVIPYVDENGIPQKPRFGISSIGGKAIREWSEKVYEQIVKAKRVESASIQEKTSSAESTKNEDPIHVLKLRFAKGEITKEEFEDMKKMLE